MDRGVAKRLTGSGSSAQVLARVRQDGAVLFIALALLMAITAGALSGALTTTLELRISRNRLDTALALQAADAALAEAEAWLEVHGDPSGGGGADLPTGQRYGEVPVWRDHTAWTTHGRTARTTLPGVFESPRVLIEWVTTFEIDLDGVPPPETVVDVFRVTAMGFGSSPTTVVRVQGTYARDRSAGGGARTRRLSWVELEP